MCTVSCVHTELALKFGELELWKRVLDTQNIHLKHPTIMPNCFSIQLQYGTQKLDRSRMTAWCHMHAGGASGGHRRTFSSQWSLHGDSSNGSSLPQPIPQATIAATPGATTTVTTPTVTTELQAEGYDASHSQSTRSHPQPFPQNPLDAVSYTHLTLPTNREV